MDNPNEIFSIRIDNVDLHFIIHYESFLQINDAHLKASHSHVYYEILYSVGGSNKLLFNDSEVHLKNNTVSIIPPYYIHRTFYEQPSDLLSLGFHYEKIKNKHAKNDLYSMLEAHFSGKSNIGILNEGLRELFVQLQGFYRVNDPIHDGLMIAMLVRIFYNILAILAVDTCNDNTNSDESAFDIARKPYSPHGISFDVLYEINEALNAHYTENITPAILSERYFISQKQINRYILKQYGKTFLQRRTELRILSAQRLLRETNDSIAVLSQKVGYNSINSFYSAFKSYTGITPDQYRQGNDGSQDDT